MDLNSLNMENIENIMASLSSEDIEKLTSMAGEFFSSSQTNAKNKAEEKAADQSSQNFFGFGDIDPAAFVKIAQVMNKLSNSADDPRCNFLAALKPLLSSQKQQKTDEAIRMIQLLSALEDLSL